MFNLNVSQENFRLFDNSVTGQTYRSFLATVAVGAMTKKRKRALPADGGLIISTSVPELSWSLRIMKTETLKISDPPQHYKATTKDATTSI